MLNMAKKAKKLVAAIVVLVGAGMLAGCGELLGLALVFSVAQLDTDKADPSGLSFDVETMAKETATYWTDAHAGVIGGNLRAVVVHGEYHLLSAEHPEPSDDTLVGPATPGVTINIYGTGPKDWCVEGFDAESSFWVSASTPLAEGLCP
jgi:hypothetical protein